MGSFDRDNQYKSKAGFNRVVFGAKKPVTELELNEAQLIQNTQVQRLVENIVGDGISDLSAITYENSVLTIGDCFFSCSGYLIHNTGLSIELADGETAYLQVWEEEVTHKDTLKEEGNEQSETTVENTILTPDFGDIETTRRIVVKYTLAKSTNSKRKNLAVAKIVGEEVSTLVGLTASHQNIQGRLDSIQTTSRATLSMAGWYRVAEYKATSEANLRGNNSHSCEITLRRINSSASGTYRLGFESRYDVHTFKVRSVDIKNNIFPQIRYTYDVSSLTGYIEVNNYGTSSTGIHVTITNGTDNILTWKAITPTLTSETVDGVTVTTTYDIPASASPVTDLDLVKFDGTENLESSVLEKALELPNGIWTYHLGGAGYVGNDIPKGYNLEYGMATIEKRGSSSLTITIRSESGYVALNGYDGIAWGGWKIFATTADINVLGHKFTINDNIQDMNTIGAFTAGIVYNTASNVPLSMNSYGIAYTIGFNHDYQIQRILDFDGTMFERCERSANVFTEWKKVATTTDLANYLPLDGSVPMSGTLKANGGFCEVGGDGNHASIGAYNVPLDYTNGRRIMVLNSNYMPDSKNALQFWENVNGSVTPQILLHTGNVSDYALPIGGGTLTSAHYTGIKFETTGTPNSYGTVRKYGDGMRVGLHGTDGSYSNELVLGNNPQDENTLLRLLLNDSTFREILHNGNYKTYVTPANIGARHEWNAIITGSTWSRVCHVGCGATAVEGTKFLLNISATRNSIVYNDLFVITSHHSCNGMITKIGGNNYTAGYQIRIATNSNGDCYVELYDSLSGMTATTATQTVRCRLIPILCGAITKYTTATSGATLASGYSVARVLKTTNADFQGSLEGNASTATSATNAHSAANTAVGTASLKNMYGGTADMTAGTTALTTGTFYVMYE